MVCGKEPALLFLYGGTTVAKKKAAKKAPKKAAKKKAAKKASKKK
jgi:hypothetical protein